MIRRVDVQTKTGLSRLYGTPAIALITIGTGAVNLDADSHFGVSGAVEMARANTGTLAALDITLSSARRVVELLEDIAAHRRIQTLIVHTEQLPQAASSVARFVCDKYGAKLYVHRELEPVDPAVMTMLESAFHMLPLWQSQPIRREGPVRRVFSPS